MANGKRGLVRKDARASKKQKVVTSKKNWTRAKMGLTNKISDGGNIDTALV